MPSAVAATSAKPSNSAVLLTTRAAAWARSRWAGPTFAVLLGTFGGLALTGCPRGDGDASVQCTAERIPVRVHGSVELPATVTKVRAGQEPRVLIAVHESTSTRCEGLYTVHQAPGATLYRSELLAFGDFDFEVESQATEGVEPALQVEVLIDLNGNGTCDDGEPQGLLGVPSDGDLGSLSLPPGGCAARL